MVHSNIFYINIVLHYKQDLFLYFCLVYVYYMCENTPQDICGSKRTALAVHSLLAALQTLGINLSLAGLLSKDSAC